MQGSTVVTKTLYCALIQQHTNYCSVVWDHLSFVQERKVEAIQNAGMSIILAGSSEDSNWC